MNRKCKMCAKNDVCYKLLFSTESTSTCNSHLVLCGDCKHFNSTREYCKIHNTYMDINDYCSYGIKRGD